MYKVILITKSSSVYAHTVGFSIAALWSPAGNGLISWLSYVMFIVILLLSHLVSWLRCGI